jgi:hypothetical protein
MTEKQLFKEAYKDIKRFSGMAWFVSKSHATRRELSTGYQQPDIFGAFDMIYYIAEEVHLVQITTRKHKAEREKKILSIFKNQGRLPPLNSWIWAWNGESFYRYRLRDIH